MLLTQKVPQQRKASFLSPHKSQEYTDNKITNTNNIDKNPTAILLGVDDIEQFRKDHDEKILEKIGHSLGCCHWEWGIEEIIDAMRGKKRPFATHIKDKFLYIR